MQPACYIVTEGKADAAFASRLFRDHVESGLLGIVADRGWSSAVSGARTLLVHFRRPVALMIDADSHNRSAIEERRQDTIYLIRAAAARTPWKLIVAEPEIEAWLFESLEIAHEIFPGHSLTETLLETARVIPKQTFQRLVADDSADAEIRFFNRLSDSAVKKLLELPMLKELQEFVNDAVAQPVP